MLAPSRTEEWGRLLYDDEMDEFEAEILEDSADNELAIDRPISAGCLVTGRCNMGCKYCYGNDESLPKNELTTAEWAHVLARLRSWGLRRVDFSGGEPTLRDDIGEIVRIAQALDLNVVLSTNGSRPKSLTVIPERVRIHVSVDSGFPEVHENSRVRRNQAQNRGGFEGTLAFIRLALDQGRYLRVLTCIGPHNASGLFALGELLATIGVPEWNISRILPAGRAQDSYEERWYVADDMLVEQVCDMRKAYPSLRIRFSSRVDTNGYFLLVLPDGTLATQCTDGRDKISLGRTLEMSLRQLQSHPDFSVHRHARKWICATREREDFGSWAVSS